MGMPAGDYVRLQVGGQVDNENWLIGIWLKLTGMSAVPTLAVMNQFAQDKLAGFNTLRWNATTGTKLVTYNATGCTLSRGLATFYRDGNAIGTGTGAITAVPGTAGVTHPFYSALCISTVTNFGARSQRGRMYVPATGVTLTAATGQTTLVTITAITDCIKAWLADLTGTDSSLPGTPTKTPVVVSAHAATAGQANTITGVKADTKLDTQHGRTRRTTATATYTASVP